MWGMEIHIVAFGVVPFAVSDATLAVVSMVESRRANGSA
jgi:hypothetical protein